MTTFLLTRLAALALIGAFEEVGSRAGVEPPDGFWRSRMGGQIQKAIGNACLEISRLPKCGCSPGTSTRATV